MFYYDMPYILKQFTTFLCICLTLLLGLAVFGFFSKLLVLIVVLFGLLGFLIVILLALGKKKLKFRKADVWIVIGIIIFSLFLSFFHHGLPSGRDDASYMSSAIELTKTGSLSFEDKITHAFTGFRNLGGNKFTSQFLPGYVVYLASYYILGGMGLMLWANFILILLSFCFVYFICRDRLNWKTGLLALAFLGTFYTTFWFTRRLNSENLFMMLFWFSAFLIIHGLKRKNFTTIALAGLPLCLNLMVRAEAVLYFVVACALIAVVYFSKKVKRKFFDSDIRLNWKFWLTKLWCLFILILGGFYLVRYNGMAYFRNQFYGPWQLFSQILIYIVVLVILLLIIWLFIPERKEKSKKVLNYLGNNFQPLLLYLILLIVLIYEVVLFAKGASLKWSFYQVQFNFKVLAFYLLLFYIIIIFFGLRRKVFGKYGYVLDILVLPTFLFLIRAHISIDQPWFMRRFFPVFVPYLFILTAVVVNKLKSKKIFRYAIVLIILNLTLSLPIIFYSENKGVEKLLGEFADQFDGKSSCLCDSDTANDLIIMDPGWGWQKWSYALHYYYGLDVLPTRKLFPKRDFMAEVQKYEANLDDDEAIIYLKKFFDESSHDEFRMFVENYENVYFMNEKGQVIVYPYKFDNLEEKEVLNLKYKSLSSVPGILQYLKSKDVRRDEISYKVEKVPPVLKAGEDLELQLFKVKDKSAMFL